MADVQISALPAASSAAGTDEIPANQSGTTRKITVDQLFTAPSFSSYLDLDAVADPAAPSAGVVRLYGRSMAGKIIPKWVGPSGIDTMVQASLAGTATVLWLPSTAATVSIAWGTVWTINTTGTTPAIASTNLMTAIRRAVFTTTTTAANTTGLRSTQQVVMRGAAAGQGGFFFAARFGILTYTATMRVWCGLSALATAIAGDPSAQNNTVAMSKDTGETVWQVMTRDASAAHKTSTGRTTAAAANAEIFDFYAFCPPGNAPNITVRVVDVATGTVLVDNVLKDTNLPVAGTALYAHCEAQNVAGGAGSAVAIFLTRMYIETDL